MAYCNENFLSLQTSHIIDGIEEKKKVFQNKNPGENIISFRKDGETVFLVPAVAKAMISAINDLSGRKHRLKMIWSRDTDSSVRKLQSVISKAEIVILQKMKFLLIMERKRILPICRSFLR